MHFTLKSRFLDRSIRWFLSCSKVVVFWVCTASLVRGDTVSVESLLREMADPMVLTRFPEPDYQCLQASSYNRASTHRDQPDRSDRGWFADSDGVGFIRTEIVQGRKEYVLMEHQGPGCLTKIWTPFFYYDFNNRVGPNVRIYLDGAEQPILDESLIRLVRGEGTLVPPLAMKTARAGDSYVPIPFAKSCRITMLEKPFYNLINYRAYPPGTAVETFTLEGYRAAEQPLLATAKALASHPVNSMGVLVRRAELKPGQSLRLKLPRGENAIAQLAVDLAGAEVHPGWLRSTVLAIQFDGEETVWCPIGDFFCSADSLHPFHTWQRSASPQGRFTCRWMMPYRRSGQLRLINLGGDTVPVGLDVSVRSRPWDDRSMHFYARWRSDDVVPGSPFQDWNFVDIRGQGIYVGDAWTVLNIQGGWWGEGDEKIYVDGAWDRGFPTHFGTGSEDYYGWAGGENPTRRDEFSTPFLANVRVGGLNADTIGYNICTRSRSLDAIPFRSRLVFDMESSFGVDIRHPWDLLGYSAVTFWYGAPGVTHNRPASPAAAARPMVSVQDLRARSNRLKVEASSVR